MGKTGCISEKTQINLEVTENRSIFADRKNRSDMDIIALTIIAIMSLISGIAAVAVLIDMYNSHKTRTA